MHGVIFLQPQLVVETAGMGRRCSILTLMLSGLLLSPLLKAWEW